MIVSGGTSVASARAMSEPAYVQSSLRLAANLECARQGLSKLIVNLKNPDLPDSQKSLLREDSKQRLNTMSDNLALISGHKALVAASNYECKSIHNQHLDLASVVVRADYNALQTALDISAGGKHVRFAPQE